MSLPRRKAHVVTENWTSVCGDPGGVFAVSWWQSTCRACREHDNPEPREVEQGGILRREHAVICGECQRSMRLIVRKDGRGCFYGCTGYAKGRCNNTCKARDDGTPLDVVRVSRDGPFRTATSPEDIAPTGSDGYPDTRGLFNHPDPAASAAGVEDDPLAYPEGVDGWGKD